MTTETALLVSNIALLLGSIACGFALVVMLRARRNMRDLIKRKDERIKEIYVSGFAEIEKRDTIIANLSRENIELLKRLGEPVP